MTSPSHHRQPTTPQNSEGASFHAALLSRLEIPPSDPILGLRELFNTDRRGEKKHSEGIFIGEYRDQDGRFHVPETVMLAEDIVRNKERSGVGGKGYSGMAGLANFLHLEREILIDPNEDLSHTLNVIQTVGGTEAVFLGARFLRKHASAQVVYFSDPTWSNHYPIFKDEGYQCKSYPYYNHETHSADFDRMVNHLTGIPTGSVVLLHGACHNPTGADLNDQKWDQLALLMREYKLIPLLDIAYQGFGVGIREDMYPVLAMAKQGLTFVVAHSYSKTLGLYGERLGALTVVSEHAHQVQENLKLISRHTHSNPPIHGAKIAAEIFGEPELRVLWESELQGINKRIYEMRNLFAEKMHERVGETFDYVKTQRGMFSILDLTKAQVIALRERHAVYILESGRINFAGLNLKNINYVCESIADVIKNPPIVTE